MLDAASRLGSRLFGDCRVRDRLAGDRRVRDRLAGDCRVRDRLAVDRFAADDRAIEGLPVRLVIAFVVGVATLSVMLSMVNGVNTLAVSELDAKPSPDVVAPGEQTIEVAAVDADGNPVAGTTVVVKSGTADVEGVATATTNENGVATLRIAPSLGPNQDEGTLRVSLKPPAGSEYVDRRENTAVLVVRA